MKSYKMSNSKLIKSRVFASVLGALVADVAVRPFHGLTDVDEIKEIIGDSSNPEFSEQWHNPLCPPQTGKISCYGKHCYIMLQTIVENKKFVMEVYKQKLKEAFGTGSEYDPSTPSNDENTEQKEVPYLVESLQDAALALEAGEEKAVTEDMILDSCIALVPLVAFYAGSGLLSELVEDVIRVTINNDVTVQTAQIYAQILENYILNGENPQSVANMVKKLPYRDEYRDIIHEGWHALKYDKISQPVYVSKIGSGTGLPVCFMAVIHGLSSRIDYVYGVRDELRSGGASCLRAGLIGACLAASQGPKSIPDEWLKKTVKGDWYRKMVTRLAEYRPEEPIGKPTKRTF